MATRAPAVHWLRGNKGERTPRRIIVLDTESRQSEAEGRELHELRCWVARVIDRGPEGQDLRQTSEFQGVDRDSLTAMILATVKPKTSWRLFTHNLSFDLGLTRLPLELLALGWSLGKHNLASEAPWAYLKKGGRGLWLCDSWSWLPTSVEKLGEALGLQKPALPGPLDAEADWMARCRADVEIEAAALLQLLDEWDRAALGWWSITGPASGWNTLLHFPARSSPPREDPLVHKSANPKAKHAQARVLIVPDPEARLFERRSLYSGRRDVWRVGRLPAGPYSEVDLRQAHLSIAAHYPLPFRRWAAFRSLELDDWRLETPGAGTVAEVVVRTDTPRYPCRFAGAVLHPVGQFTTVLAGPEILDARERGALVSIGPGYGYHLGHQMRDWAQWALAVINTADGSIPPMLQMAVRSWGRSVPGRWGMTHAREVKSGDSHVKGWELEPVTIGMPPRRGFIFHCAGKWTESVSDEEAEDSFPAVLAYIQSYCRLALNAMLDAIPEGCLVSCNTEGAWVADSGLRRVCGHGTHTCGSTCKRAEGWHYTAVDLSAAVAPLEVRIKQTTHRLKVLSPQHHQTDQARLYSGIPRAAEEIQPDQFTFWTWPKLKGQIERGDPRGYVRERRTVNLAGIPVSRWAFEDGACEPVTVSWSPGGGNVINPPCAELLAHHGPLRAVQHPVLRRALASAN